MNKHVCDPSLLTAFVRGELDARAEHVLTTHLDECESCGQTLEHKVAEAAEWQEARELLGNGALQILDASHDHEDHRDSQIELVLAQLGPTDDPDSLGRIGGYEVTGVIGSGGMGVVLKAQDRSLDRVVAVKVMAPHLAASGSARQRFAREAKAAAAVLHPNVIAIHGVSNDQSLPYLVMPYVRGASLQKRIDAEGPLPAVDILRIGSQIAAGLAAAHGQGLVHRDIKPANMLLEQGIERVAITDFGLARAVDDASMTRSGVIAGTPQYMSPEQARGEVIDARSDLFSLGSLLYAMCTGHSPFRAETSYGVLHRITHDAPRAIRELNPNIPQWLEMIVMKLLSKSRDDRIDSAEAVSNLLEGCLAHVQQPTTVPLPPSIAQLPSIEIPAHSTDPTKTVSVGDKIRRTGKRFIGPPIGKYLAAAAAAAAFLFAGVVIVLELDKGTLTIKSVADNVPIRIVQGKDTVQELTVSKQGVTTRLRAGTYTVEIDGDATAYDIQGDNVMIKRGEDRLVNVSIGRSNSLNSTSEQSIEGIQWSTFGPDDGLLSGARLILPDDGSLDGGVLPGQPVAIEYRLKNISKETKKLTAYVRGNREHITISKDNRITDPGITTADDAIEITLQPGKEYVATSHRASIDTRGLAPGDYQVALGPAFFRPDPANPNSKQEIPHRGNISLKILPPDAITNPLLRDLHWGKPVSGLRLGAKFRSKSNSFAIGSVVEADLWIANATNRAVECSILLPHPIDGWLFNIQNGRGETIMLERPPMISMFHPQEFFVIQLEPGEVQHIAGERTEGQVDKVAGPCAKFEIVNSKENQGWDRTIKGRLVTQGGDYSAVFNVTLQQSNVPHMRIELETDNCPFSVGQADSVLSNEKQTIFNSVLGAAKPTTIPLSNTNGKAAVESIRELCIILGIEEPRLLALDGTPHVVDFAPGEGFHSEVTDWIKLVDLSNSKNSGETEDAQARIELASLRRRVLDHLSAQAELRLTQLILDNLVSHEQGSANQNGGQAHASKLAEETMAALRQKAADKLNELRSATQETAVETDLQEQLEPGKSEVVITPYPLKFVKSQQAETTILNTSRLFGILPEVPASDIRTNVLIIEKNGRQKYFTCLAATIDHVSQEDAMSFDERIELWKDRLLLLAMLKVAVGDNNSVDAKAIRESIADREKVAEKEPDARSVVEAYVAAAIAGDRKTVQSLTGENPQETEQLAKTIDSLILNLSKLDSLVTKTVIVNSPDCPSKGIALSETLKWEHRTNPSADRIDVRLRFDLSKSDQTWSVIEIGIETEELGDELLKKFLEANPTAISVLPRGSTEKASGGNKKILVLDCEEIYDLHRVMGLTQLEELHINQFVHPNTDFKILKDLPHLRKLTFSKWSGLSSDEIATITKSLPGVEVVEEENHLDRKNARSVVEGYIALALAGDVAKAAALAKNSPADPKRIRELPKFLNVQRLKIETVYINDPAKPTRALATSVAVKLDGERKPPDGQRDGFIVFGLEFTEDKWLVIDVDFESESGAEKELKRFLAANPGSIGLPPQP